MAKFKDYISQTVPKEYSDIALGNVGALKYGKDFETDMPRKNEQVTRLIWSDKIHNSGEWIITWILPIGLNIEHTSMYMAQTTETRLVELWGEQLKNKRKTTIERKIEEMNLPQDVPSIELRDASLSDASLSEEGG